MGRDTLSDRWLGLAPGEQGGGEHDARERDDAKRPKHAARETLAEEGETRDDGEARS